jgi:hypothetical protein
MKRFRRLSLIVGVSLLAACDRGRSAPPVDSANIRAQAAADSVAVATSATRNWDASAGPVLLVVGSSPMQALVIPPDSASSDERLADIPRPASVTLLSRGGTVQSAELPAVSNADGCASTTLRGAPPPRAWNVGFIGGVVAPIALDSTESFSAADSTSLATEVTRLASILPNDSAGRFTGLPFLVRSLWRFPIADGRIAIVATLTRQINQEATPLQEHTLLVAERSATDSSFVTTYSERSHGVEETIESRELIAALLIGSARTPALILAHDYGDSAAYALVERGDNGVWRQRWLSARHRCLGG